MKKIFLIASALAGLFLAASCQQENLEPVGGGTTVTYTVEAPGALQTKAIADGTNVDELIYEVWYGDQKLYQNSTAMAVDPADGKNKAKVTLDLVNDQTYTILFWAQVAEADAYVTDELTAVTYAKGADEYLANDESLAAFYAVDTVVDGVAAHPTVLLKRPFAQVNLCTLNSKAAAQVAGDYNITMVNSKMTLESVPTTFNVLDGSVDGEVKMEFAYNAVPGGEDNTIKVNGKEYYYAGMNYVFAGANLTLTYDIQTSLNGSTSYAVVNNVISDVPVRENYRTNIVGNLLTSKTDYEIIVDAEFEIPDNLVGEGVVFAKNSDELVAALKRNEAHLVIELVGTQTKGVTPVEFMVPVGAWTEKYYFGGDKTRDITINANGNKINFVHENSDWNYIRMVNDNAKWIINDATLTNSGKNDGPWNRHDIRFYNAVELNNVTSDKAIALLNDGKLNNVTVTEDTGVYGLWITAEGQTVDINGMTITATNGGRGIAIKDQYVNTPACVTVNVANAKFTTASKAAVLVTSKAGAVINWGAGNDIQGVAADTEFAVWVDEDYKAYADKVVVNGCFCKVEGDLIVIAEVASELVSGLKVQGQTVWLFPSQDGDSYELGGKISIAKGASLIGKGDEPVGVDNDWGSTTFANQAHFTDTHIENIFFDDNMVIDAAIANGNVSFKDCIFGGSLAHQGVHFDSGTGVVVFDNCTFVGRNMFGSSLEKVVFNNCTFLNKKSSLTGSDKWTGVNMWGKYEFNNCVFDTDATCNVKTDGVEASFTNCTYIDGKDIKSLIRNGSNYNATITFDGVLL